MIASLDGLFARLPGVWSIARNIEDTRLGPGRFEGEATFVASADNTVRYEERGELAIGNWRGPAYRSWLYVSGINGLSIFYPDAKTLLHHFALPAGAGRAEHTHVCGEDLYRATLACDQPDRFTLEYEVTGPSKRYRLTSMYSRIP